MTGDDPGNRSEKTGWDDGRIGAVNEAVFVFIDEAKREGSMADLSGVVFPAAISFECCVGEGNALPVISFEATTFGGDASFRRATFNGDARFDGTNFGGKASFERATFSDDAWFNGSHLQR